GHGMANPAQDGLAERCNIIRLYGVERVQRIRMTAHGTLAEHDKRTREDIRAFHGNADRRAHVTAAEDIVRPLHDTGTGHDIHAIQGQLPADFRGLFLEQRGNHRWFETAVDTGADVYARGFHRIGKRRDTGNLRFHTFHP